MCTNKYKNTHTHTHTHTHVHTEPSEPTALAAGAPALGPPEGRVGGHGEQHLATTPLPDTVAEHHIH